MATILTVDIISMDEVRRRHSGHFFDAGTTRFFRSRYPQTAYQGPGGTFFVTSEQFVPSSGKAWDRQYTVRSQSGTGDITTVGEFNKMTRAAANGAARRLAATRSLSGEMLTCQYCKSTDIYGQAGDPMRECAECGAKWYATPGEWISPKTLAKARRAEAMVRSPFDE